MWISVSKNYEASNDGHIRNKNTLRVLKEFEGKDGYLRTQFDGKTQTIHRVIAKAFFPRIQGKMFNVSSQTISAVISGQNWR